MRILLVASECVPWAKAGGLGDVVAALAPALAERGHEVRIVLPRYRSIDVMASGFVDAGSACIHMGEGIEQWVGVYEARLAGTVGVWLIECDRFFGGQGIYGSGAWDSDEPMRFAFLSKAAIELALDRGFVPDVVHAHDWPTAVACAWVARADEVGLPGLSGAASVLTIHNVQYQGRFSSAVWPWLGLPAEWLSPEVFGDIDGLNLLKGGAALADLVTTVSPTHAREMCGEPGGHGLGGFFAARADRLVGILNGVDEERWDPATDPLLPAQYSAGDLSGKAVCRAELQACLGLEARSDIPIVGMVSRFAPQKGFDLAAQVVPAFVEGGAMQLVVVGSGDAATEAFVRALAERFPGSVGMFIGYSEDMAHLVEAGADLFLMPSLYEPCGLNQMYSMRYGTLPIVRATGGLADTVEDASEDGHRGTGFVFTEPTAEALEGALARALALWTEAPAVIERLRQRAMLGRHTWQAAALQYEQAYLAAREHHARLRDVA